MAFERTLRVCMHMYTVYECLSVCVNFKACYSEQTPLASLAPLLRSQYVQAFGDLKKHEKPMVF